MTMIRVSNDLGPHVTHNDNADNDYDDDERDCETRIDYSSFIRRR